MKFLSPQRDFGGRQLRELGWTDPTHHSSFNWTIYSANIFLFIFYQDVLVDLRNGPLDASLSREPTTQIKK